ncbi:hypothetical protein LOZ52_002847 [Ophidiomyces ophidiicola]|nr:hypothetical protein LOZ64_003323 [Ophidiomyces ophidiicola]KAI2013717.1 hypothetical protein LOZ49_001910 [Ophidiomyces ophidiicola]KAI2016654.1 hypothetical protein LOZ46_004919 [Ophidiomyces ophidiicola]KAI2132126.1 hypothetical protein LOZ29_005244 [Ophidiomyces ophidiicola]KAI2428058.1 hypothetical protein LOZ52_002847 [Ophidiomyces ophidiicola]
MNCDIWLAGIGCFAHVIRIGDTGYVVKKSLKHPVVPDLLPVEKQIYERLGHHQSILQYYGEYQSSTDQSNGVPSGLVFQYLPGGTLAEKLALSEYPEQRPLWPMQASKAIQYIHSKNVIHCDIGCHNFLIRDDGSIVLADFGGSMIDGTLPKVCYATRYQLPLSPERVCEDNLVLTIKDEIFALGTLIYEMTVGHRLYPDQQSVDVQRRLRAREFPALDELPINIQTVVSKCWAERYESVDEVLHDLESSPALTAGL